MASLMIITTCYNKPKELREAYYSLWNQTRGDWEWCLNVDVTAGPKPEFLRLVSDLRQHDGRITGGLLQLPKDKYRPAAIWNWCARNLCMASYVHWLSDDDLLEPRFVELMVGHLEAHPDHDACYCKMVTERWWINRYVRQGIVPAVEVHGKDGPTLCGRLDGSQVVLTRRVLDRVPRPWYPEEGRRDVAAFADGMFMDKLRLACDVHPVGEHLFTKRMGPLSEFYPAR